MDKSRDFRGIWRTRGGNFANIIEPILNDEKFCMGWKGQIFDTSGFLLQNSAWYSNGIHYLDPEWDLIERKRGQEYSGNEAGQHFEWPELKET